MWYCISMWAEFRARMQTRPAFTYRIDSGPMSKLDCIAYRLDSKPASRLSLHLHTGWIQGQYVDSAYIVVWAGFRIFWSGLNLALLVECK